MIECALQRQDDELRSAVQAILDTQGENASMEMHKNCYCSYTSKVHIKRYLAKKRKEDRADSDDAPAARMRRSQVTDFEFKTQCLFCANVCEPLNPKHPERWDRVIQCERLGVKNAPPFKDIVLQHCGDRSDSWGREVALRCHGAHDLAAAEAQYHLRCYNEFRKVPVHTEQTPFIDDAALQSLVDEMFATRKHCTWTSLEMHDKYVAYGGCLSRKQMFTKLLTYLGEDVVVLSIQGCASIVGFREFVGKILKLSKLDTTDEEGEDVLVRKITTEARGIPTNNKQYDLGDFTFSKTKENTSDTLLRFISKLVSNGKVTKQSTSLSQSIQFGITNTGNQSTLGLGVKLHHKFGSSDLIQILHEHGYCVSYDEVIRFRKSAAKYVTDNAATLHQMMGLSRTVGLVFGWYDNFDLSVSTPNGRRETHAMATEFQIHPAGIIEPGTAQLPGISTLVIPRLTSKQYKSSGDTRAIPLMHYTGPKKVIPPAVQPVSISYTDVCSQATSLTTAQEKDTIWLNTLGQEDAMEWNGFNNEVSRTQGVLHPANMYVFGPLIDAPPSHPDTVLTTLTYMQRSMVDMGMEKVHLCMDMQLYAVTKQVCWNQPKKYQNVVVHPGGMKIIQSFLGRVGTLMKGSGLEWYITKAYGGLTGIFNGKSWVKAMRAFRGVAAALLQRLLSSGQKTFEEIEQYLETARLHPTGRHWVDNFLLPTLLIHQFERAEREGDIHLKHLTLKRMMKYFFLAGHVQYARYMTQYLIEMRANTEDMVDLVCRHQDGYWNAVSADQFGEQTAIRIGKGALKGMTLSADLVSEWINAFPITCTVSDRLDGVYSQSDPGGTSQKLHKEEMKYRRKLDASDRGLIFAEVDKYPHPLEDNRPHLYNPVTGQIASADVNVADSIVIGERMERDFVSSLPDGFYNSISSPINTMCILKGQAKGSKSRPLIELETIFLRLLMIGQQRKIELGPLFAYELCAVPPALIDGQGCLRKGNKSGLVKRLGVVDIYPKSADTLIVDVSQLFYHMVWPHGGNPSDLIASIEERLSNYGDATKKIVVFDKYQDVSAKDHERMRRAGEVVIDYDLSIASHLPKREAIMKSKSNKRKLASVLGTFDLGESTTMETRDDSKFLHDEADVTMVSFVLEAAKSGQGVIRVLSDDTDVFVLLVYWVNRANLQCKVQMERWDGSVLDINATCAGLGQKCLQLPAMHALSGCDTTSYPYGKGKVTALNTMTSGDYPGLAIIGDVGTTRPDLMTAAMPFFIALYGQPQGTSMESVRFTLFTKKKRNPKVMSLPPTSANLMQHILRAHLQVMLWKAANCNGPPDESKDITQFGWEFRDEIPIPVIAEGDPAPPELLDVIRCQCKAQGKKCSTEACGCHKQHLSCTTFCNCRGSEDCLNQYTTARDVPAAEEGPATDVDNIDDCPDDGLEEDMEDQEDIADDQVPDYLDEWE
ncbi:MAG: hypothetical protein JAY96_15870 [Candidatus Thiodiazotropha endolucinida]|nr:hypothetical protein [Candidatus Thiodiazotropha taylori]MCW4249670.1 hypothetical protein [Candidatus Thiodiazotropha endolucinida]